MKIIVLLMFGLLLPSVHAGNDAAAPGTAQAASITKAPPRGTLYRVRDHGRTAYLFGTIHVGQPAFYPLEDKVTGALRQAARVVVELDVRDGGSFQSALARHGTYAAGDSVERHLSPGVLGHLRTALARFDIPLEQVAHFKPWLLANMLLGLDLERNGYRRAEGIEFFLLSAAQQQATPVRELESAEYQLGLYDGMAEAEQEDYVRETLAQLLAGEAIKRARNLVDAWDNADGTAVEAMLKEETRDDTVSGRFMQKVLLDKRNPEMAEKIAGYMQDEGTTFVGVGLLHLVGENGVPRLLQQRGYEVEKLY